MKRISFIVFVVFFISVSHAAIKFSLKRTLAKEEAPSLLSRIRDSFGEKLRNTHDVIYKGSIEVGTPPKKFSVVFDTGSGLFWLPLKGCKSSGPHADACGNNSLTYDPKRSSTSRSTRQRFRMYYGTGKAIGKIYKDDVSLGENVHMKSVQIGGAHDITYIDHGIIGLSLPDHKNPQPLFFEAFNRKVFEKPIFTTFMKKCDNECDEGGMVTLGGFDSDHCVNDIHWVPVVPGTSMWRFQITGMKVGSYEASSINEYAITDTGTSYIQIPKKLFPKVVAELRAEKMKDYYVMPCDSKFEMEFMIHGNSYKVTEKEVLLNQGYGEKCVVAIGNAGIFDMFLLGDAFVRGWCQVYDIKQRKVGFAPVKH